MKLLLWKSLKKNLSPRKKPSSKRSLKKKRKRNNVSRLMLPLLSKPEKLYKLIRVSIKNLRKKRLK